MNDNMKNPRVNDNYLPRKDFRRRWRDLCDTIMYNQLGPEADLHFEFADLIRQASPESLRWLADQNRTDLYKKTWSVGLYLHDKAFGGHEEGGWWRDTYALRYYYIKNPTFNPDDVISERYLIQGTRVYVFEDEWDAEEFAARWNELLKKINKGRRPPSSVLSEGHYVARVYEGDCPSFDRYPKGGYE